MGSSAILAAVRPTADRAAVPFAKVSVFESPVAMERLVQEIGGGIAVVANSVANEGWHAGELYQRGISKADGVAAAIAHLGIAREDTIAIGDGANDLEMLAYAGVGVAIEGPPPSSWPSRTALQRVRGRKASLPPSPNSASSDPARSLASPAA